MFAFSVSSNAGVGVRLAQGKRAICSRKPMRMNASDEPAAAKKEEEKKEQPPMKYQNREYTPEEVAALKKRRALMFQNRKV